jgi:hypothetical protein
MDDLDIPVLHIVFEGDSDKGNPSGNGHTDKVVVMCDKIDRKTLQTLE